MRMFAKMGLKVSCCNDCSISFGEDLTPLSRKVDGSNFALYVNW